MRTETVIVAIASLLVCAGFSSQTQADPLYWSSSGTWTSANAWGNAPGVYSGSTWADGSDAVFAGSPGTVTLQVGVPSINSITFSTDGYLITGTKILTLTGSGGSITTGNGTDTINSYIGGSVGLTKSGAGNLILGAQNIYNGDTNVNGGTLTAASAKSVGTANHLYVNNTGVFLTSANSSFGSCDGTVTSTAGLLTPITVNAGGILMNGTNILTQIGALDLEGGTLSSMGAGYNSSGVYTNFTLRSPNITVGTATTGTSTINAKNVRLGNSNGVTFTVGDGSTLNITGNIISTIAISSAFIKAGSGTIILAGANTFVDGLILQSGSLKVGVDSVYSSGSITSSAVGTGNLTLNGGALSSNDTSARTLYNAFVLGGDAAFGDATNNGALTFNGAGTLTGTRTLTVNSRVTFAGVINDGGSGYGLTKTGSGELILGGSNTYTGSTVINAGKLTLAAGGDIAAASAIKVADGATYQVNLNSGTLLSAADVRSQLTGSGIDGLVAQLHSTSGMASAGSITMAWRARATGEEANLAANVLTLTNTSDAMPTAGYLLTMAYDDYTTIIGGTAGEAVLAAAGNIRVAQESDSKWTRLGTNFRSDLTSISLVQAAAIAGTLNIGDYGVDATYNLAWVGLSGDVAGTYSVVVPEPGTVAILTTALLGLIAYAWRKRK